MFVSQLLQEKRCADEYLHCLIPRCGDLKKTYFPIILVCQNFMKASSNLIIQILSLELDLS